MKILFIHNKYYKTSGEEVSVSNLIDLLRQNGHEVKTYFRSSEEMNHMPFPKINAFLSGIHNKKSAKEVDEIIQDFKPDLVQIQNIYPFISPSVFAKIKSRNVAIVMRTPNYRLFCPNGLFMRPDKQICEKCTGGLREFNCIRFNCESNLFKSTSYAFRNYLARVRKTIIPNVNMFIVQSEFQKQKFINNGISIDRIDILPALLPKIVGSKKSNPRFVSFVGRLSSEKGIEIFVGAAKLLPDVSFAIAGSPSKDFNISDLPSNIKYFGFLNDNELSAFYSQTRILIVPSLCYEGFPNVIVAAMSMKIPVIASDIGVLNETINKTKCGVLYNPYSIEDLATNIGHLYSNPELINKYGDNGYQSYCEHYTISNIYNKLMSIYERSLELSGKKIE